jgi:hypothetical protein
LVAEVLNWYFGPWVTTHAELNEIAQYLVCSVCYRLLQTFVIFQMSLVWVRSIKNAQSVIRARAKASRSDTSLMACLFAASR